MWSGKKCSEGGAGTPTEEEIKVVLVGDTQCRKTSIVQRFVSDTFVEVNKTTECLNQKLLCYHCYQSLLHYLLTNHQGCYRCLCHVYTYCTITSECEDDYCGPFNITRVHWEEGGKVTMPDDDPERQDAWKDCAKDYLCAQKIIAGYMKRFSKDCNDDGVVNCFDYMMINSNDGPDCSHSLNSTTGRIWIGRYEECHTAGLLT